MSERLLVLAPNWLGDTVMALPALADLRRAAPSAHLAVAARPPLPAFLSLVPGVDEVIALEGTLRQQVRTVAAGRFDRVVLLPNSFRAAWLAWRAGIPERWGYARDGRSLLLTRRAALPPTPCRQAEYYQTLTERLGVARGPAEPRLVLPAAVLDDARALLAARGHGPDDRLVVIAPATAFGPAKQWPARHVAALAAMLSGTPGLRCVLVGGRADLETARAVRAELPPETAGRVIDLIGEMTLPVTVGMVALASACVGNDSAIMHIAAALGVPVAGLFGPTDERLTAPTVRPGARALVLTNPVACRPCFRRTCNVSGHPCLAGITPARVRASLDALLS